MIDENINIRLATYDDCKNLSHLKKEIWETTYRGIYPDEKIDNYDYIKNEEKFKSFIDNENQFLYVVTYINEIVGYIEFGEPFRPFRNYEQEIGLFYLKKDFQGKGIGKTLFNLVYDYFKSLNIDKFFISCHKFNVNARAFYEKMGGIIVQVDDDSDNDGFPQVKFEYLVK